MFLPFGKWLRSRLVLSTLVVLAAIYLIYFAGLGRNALLEPDEPIYGQFIKEMVVSGDWITPHYAGKLWFDKPPMYYWLSAICVKVLGPTELAIRFPSALFAALTVLMVYLLASYDFGKRAGILAAAVAGTTLMQVVMSHAAATDAVMVFFMTAALYAYRRWLDSDGHARLGWITACGAAAGLGMLTKGPVVPFLLSLTFITHLAWTRNLRKLKLVCVIAGAGICLDIGLSWFAAMYVLHGSAFVDGFIVANNLSRFAKPLHESQGGQWYSHFRSVMMALLFFFPWTVFLPQAIRSRGLANVGSKLALCWSAFVLVFFSMSATQNFTYTYPIFPALAVHLGALFAGESAGRDWTRSVPRLLRVGLGFTLLLGASLIVVATRKFPGALPGAIATSCALIAIFALPMIAVRFGRMWAGHSPWIMAAGVVMFSLVTVNVLMPSVSDYVSSKTIARRLADTPGVHVVEFKLWKPGIFYYMSKKPAAADNARDIRRLARSSRPILFICSERDEHEVESICPVEVFGYGNLDVYANNAYLHRLAER